ncbi:MAG: PAS domain S-box protein [Rhodospirillaceae bacterium]|nr:PAS domain S-box protein [Rhodospirillaceae bacterium]MBT6828966.1 PAS domain S-box protein [Rhodospirillaceae bacterium]
MALIAIVDDQITNRRIYSRLAASLVPGADVQSFADPIKALEWSKGNIPDIVISDFQMGTMNGASFTAAFRAQTGCEDVPVIIVTAFEDKSFRYRALDAGATDFITSPVDAREFGTRLRNLLRLRRHQLDLQKRGVQMQQKLEKNTRLGDQALRQSEEMLRLVIDTVPALISATDGHSNFEFVNRKLAETLHMTPEDAVGKTVGDLMGEEFGRRSRETDQQVFESGKTIAAVEENFDGVSGEAHTFITTKSPLRDQDGSVRNVVTVSLDITERVAAERQLHKLSSAVEQSPHAVIIAGPDGMVEYVNSRFAEITGLNANEYLGGDLFAWNRGAMPPQDPAETLREAEESGSARREFQLQRGGGSAHWCREMTSVIRGDDGEVMHYLSITEDISERKQVEAQLIQTSKLATLGQMAAGMAHELNQPLYIIRMAADRCLMEMDAGTLNAETEREHFQIVSEQCQRMADIIGHLRIFGRRDALEPSLMDPAACVRQAVDMVLEQYRLEDIEIVSDIPEQAHAVMGHPIRLEQVLVNLLGNAHDAILEHSTDDAASPKGRIAVTLADDAEGNSLSISVSDSGGGISQDKMDSIFEPFFTTKEVGRGMGLGLSVSQSIISEMGGALSAKTTDNGACFSVTLPYGEADKDG